MKKINRYLFLFVFLFCSFLLKAQFDNKKYDKESFLIGTLNEYMGYQRTFTNGDNFYYQRVDIMGENDLKHALFIDSLFSLDYSDITIVNNGAPQGIKLYSPTLSSKIDNYYHYEPTVIKTRQGDIVYSGSQKKEQFKTEKQKLSFMLGAYLRYGVDKDRTNLIVQFLKIANLLDENKEYENGAYVFSMPNAPNKANVCAELLKDLECKDVEYVISNRIPVGYYVIFIPSDKIREMITDVEILNEYIETINTDHVEFTSNGTKYIWVEPERPSFPQKGTDINKALDSK